MKYTITITIILLAHILIGQNVDALEKVPKGAKIEQGQAIIYGNFIQRLGFSSGGFPQDIVIRNAETKEYFKFRVKPTYKSSKENAFCFFIKPGTYQIISYFWTQSKWYGGMMYGEPIFKGIDANAFIERNITITPELFENDSLKYTFALKESSLCYLGTWDFSSGQVSFSNDMSGFNAEIGSAYKKLDFSKSTAEIPE